MVEDNLYALMENSLFNNLRPVSPDPQFIQKLGSRLLGTKNMRIEDPNRSAAFVVMSLGLFFGVLMVWLFKKDR